MSSVSLQVQNSQLSALCLGFFCLRPKTNVIETTYLLSFFSIKGKIGSKHALFLLSRSTQTLPIRHGFPLSTHPKKSIVPSHASSDSAYSIYSTFSRLTGRPSNKAT